MPASFELMFWAAVAVLDAEFGILLSVTSFADGTPLLRRELRDITAPAGDFRVDIPPGLPLEEERDPWEWEDAGPPGPVNIPLTAARVMAREVSREAAKAARRFMRRFGAQ